jgi:uncharacterized membrane protein
VTGTDVAGEPLDYQPPARTLRLEAAVTVVLRVGVAASSVVLALGTVITVVAASTSPQARRTVGALRHGAAHPVGLAVSRSLGDIAHGVVRGNGPAIVMVGVLLLILTPITRVAVSLAVYARERDTTFVVISATVLALLIVSFALG